MFVDPFWFGVVVTLVVEFAVVLLVAIFKGA